jgi:Secretion system C-terminal sorting domain
MQKILFIIALCFISISSFGQLTFSTDSLKIVTGRNTSITPKITITNNGNSAVTVEWNGDIANCVVPSGFTVNGLCDNNQCYPYNGATHSIVIDPKSSMTLDPQIFISPTARLDTACVIVINTDINGGKKLTWVINAQNWATAINPNKAPKISVDMYPLPAANRLNVVHNNSKVSKAVVFNLLGKKIGEYITPANTNGFSIMVNDYADGMYILDIRDANDNSLATQRFSKN